MTDQLRDLTSQFAVALTRRRFLRRTAGAAFAGMATLTAGALVKPSLAYGYTSACQSPSGPGCPHGCGPSPCCNKSSRSSACKCGTGTNCKSGTTHCHGKAGTWGGTACWTCTWYKCLPSGYAKYVTTCCDCSTSGCGDPSSRCISYKTTLTIVGQCGLAAQAVPTGTVLAVDTGDPATSWGDASSSYTR
jgi:hypothetical protein